MGNIGTGTIQGKPGGNSFLYDETTSDTLLQTCQGKPS